jgi:hypothetical protein
VPGAQGANVPGTENTEGFDDGPEDEGPEEMEAGGDFDVPEPADDRSEIEGTATMDETSVPEPPDDSKDDDLQ